MNRHLPLPANQLDYFSKWAAEVSTMVVDSGYEVALHEIIKGVIDRKQIPCWDAFSLGMAKAYDRCTFEHKLLSTEFENLRQNAADREYFELANNAQYILFILEDVARQAVGWWYK